MGSAGKRLFLETVGWLLLVAGLAAIFLPGPGLLGMFAGLALLSQQYAWAEHWVEPVKLRALKGAAEGVETWPRIVLSLLGVVGLVGCGVLWIMYPPAPSWWPLPDMLWLPGGLWTGVTQIASAVIAVALVIYSYRRFHDQPNAVEELAKAIEKSDRERAEKKERKKARRAPQPAPTQPVGHAQGADSSSGDRVR